MEDRGTIERIRRLRLAAQRYEKTLKSNGTEKQKERAARDLSVYMSIVNIDIQFKELSKFEV